jgi:hypothetical protein
MKTPHTTPTPLLPFQFDPEPATETLTAFGGLPLVAQTFRSLGLPQSVAQHLRLKQRQRGLDEATMIERVVLLNAAGGDCLEDVRRLAEEPGLPTLLGHALPLPDAARKFLYAFHREEAIALAQAQRPVGQTAFIPEETAPLQGLAQVNVDLIRAVAARCPAQRIATIDQDATIHESHKREALAHYEGGRGYQPMTAVWAEMTLVVADQFRDGNVPASFAPLPVAQAAFAALPSTIQEYFYRGDSACHESELLTWLRDPHRPTGPAGHIGFAISARMSPALAAAIQALPETAWQPYRAPGEPADALRDWAEVPFVPSEASEQRDTEPLRYVAVRVRPRQGDLFADGSSVKHFAVLSNQWDWDGARLLQWHREKAGTIEQVHDVVKNDLAGGVLPCGRFGANAAWLRLALLAHNVLTALKRLALPSELMTARPKRLRLLMFTVPGRLLTHARQLWLRLATTRVRLAQWLDAIQLLPAPTSLPSHVPPPVPVAASSRARSVRRRPRVASGPPEQGLPRSARGVGHVPRLTPRVARGIGRTLPRPRQPPPRLRPD